MLGPESQGLPCNILGNGSLEWSLIYTGDPRVLVRSETLPCNKEVQQVHVFYFWMEDNLWDISPTSEYGGGCDLATHCYHPLAIPAGGLPSEN